MDLYAENILDHYKNPRHYGDLPNANAAAEDNNPMCGDKVQVKFLIDDTGIIKEAAFTGIGCAISKAGASILMENIIGKRAMEVLKMNKDDVLNLLGIEISGTRLKCALLAYYIVIKALKNYEKENS
jgi:nitrogen fixation protein NifU and related proteins